MITTLRFINMSAVLYKIENNKLYIASDSIILFNGYIGSPNKKLQHIKDNIFFGATGISDTIQFIIEYMRENTFPSENPSLYELRKYFGNICKEYSEISFESAKFDVYGLLFIGNNIYRVSLCNEYDSKIEIIKLVSDIGGVGWYEMGFGCMLCGDTPTIALQKTIPYCSNLGFPIHQIVYDIEKNVILSDILIDNEL